MLEGSMVRCLSRLDGLLRLARRLADASHHHLGLLPRRVLRPPGPPLVAVLDVRPALPEPDEDLGDLLAHLSIRVLAARSLVVRVVRVLEGAELVVGGLVVGEPAVVQHDGDRLELRVLHAHQVEDVCTSRISQSLSGLSLESEVPKGVVQ